ncbi:MAG TPA: hypothetical protein VM600_02200, partial [Actinomycetota bacterium]|nr:hypothetical protein [Actinomycetota bacterium]
MSSRKPSSTASIRSVLYARPLSWMPARARTESRGGHYRGDFTSRDDVNWQKHSLAWKVNGDTKLDYKPVTITRYQPTERKY